MLKQTPEKTVSKPPSVRRRRFWTLIFVTSIFSFLALRLYRISNRNVVCDSLLCSVFQNLFLFCSVAASLIPALFIFTVASEFWDQNLSQNRTSSCQNPWTFESWRFHQCEIFWQKVRLRSFGNTCVIFVGIELHLSVMLAPCFVGIWQNDQVLCSALVLAVHKKLPLT